MTLQDMSKSCGEVRTSCPYLYHALFSVAAGLGLWMPFLEVFQYFIQLGSCLKLFDVAGQHVCLCVAGVASLCGVLQLCCWFASSHFSDRRFSRRREQPCATRGWLSDAHIDGFVAPLVLRSCVGRLVVHPTRQVGQRRPDSLYHPGCGLIANECKDFLFLGPVLAF